MRTSNHLIGLVNFLTFLLSIVILGGGIWLATRTKATDCLRFLQWPQIIIGASIALVSLAGFTGACYRNTLLQWPQIIIGASIALVSLAGFTGACYRNTLLMYIYLWAMFFIIAALIGFVIFAYTVTETTVTETTAASSYTPPPLPPEIRCLSREGRINLRSKGRTNLRSKGRDI